MGVVIFYPVPLLLLKTHASGIKVSGFLKKILRWISTGIRFLKGFKIFFILDFFFYVYSYLFFR